MDNKKAKVFRYWISKTDNKLRKETAYAKLMKLNDFGKAVYVISDETGRVIDDIPKDQFENHMLERSYGQFICLKTENDELALKHFKWALDEKIREYKKMITHCEEIKKEISF